MRLYYAGSGELSIGLEVIGEWTYVENFGARRRSSRFEGLVNNRHKHPNRMLMYLAVHARDE